MNGLGKPFRKKIQSKENSKNQSENAACEQQTLARKQFFVQTPFSIDFKIRVRKFHAAQRLAFSLHFLFLRDQNHYSNLTSKIMKMCEHILKKDCTPIQFKFFEL